jgi:flagellar motor switch protein FliM
VYDQRSFINICYPYLLMESALGRTGIKQMMSTAATEVSPEVRAGFENNVRSMDVELRAELGSTRLLLNDLMKLEEGDVILLNQRKDEPIHVYVGEQAKFKAAPGKAGNHRALRVMKVLNTDTPTKEDERVQA